MEGAAHHGGERWGTEEGDAGSERGVGVDAEESAEKHVEEEGAEGGDGGEEEDVGIDICEGLEADLRCHCHAEDEDEIGACLEGAFQTAYALVERGKDGEEADAENEDGLEGVFGEEEGDAGTKGDDADGEQEA